MPQRTCVDSSLLLPMLHYCCCFTHKLRYILLPVRITTHSLAKQLNTPADRHVHGMMLAGHVFVFARGRKFNNFSGPIPCIVAKSLEKRYGIKTAFASSFGGCHHSCCCWSFSTSFLPASLRYDSFFAGRFHFSPVHLVSPTSYKLLFMRTSTPNYWVGWFLVRWMLRKLPPSSPLCSMPTEWLCCYGYELSRSSRRRRRRSRRLWRWCWPKTPVHRAPGREEVGMTLWTTTIRVRVSRGT